MLEAENLSILSSFSYQILLTVLEIYNKLIKVATATSEQIDFLPSYLVDYFANLLEECNSLTIDFPSFLFNTTPISQCHVDIYCTVTYISTLNQRLTATFNCLWFLSQLYSLYPSCHLSYVFLLSRVSCFQPGYPFYSCSSPFSSSIGIRTLAFLCYLWILTFIDALKWGKKCISYIKRRCVWCVLTFSYNFSPHLISTWQAYPIFSPFCRALPLLLISFDVVVVSWIHTLYISKTDICLSGNLDAFIF